MVLELDELFERGRRVSIADEINRRGIILKRRGAELIGPCPLCGGKDRFSVNPSKGVWNCRGCKPPDTAGDIIGFVQHFDKLTAVEAASKLVGEEPQRRPAGPAGKPNGRPNGNGHSNGHGNGAGNGNGTPHTNGAKRGPATQFTIDRAYPYTDEHDQLRYEVVRLVPKDFRQRRPDGRGGHIWDMKGIEPLPYRLPDLVEAIATERVILVVEGERDVETLRSFGIPATCNHGGAGKWPEAINRYFDGANVVIISDHDAQSKNSRTGEFLFHEDGRPRIPGIDHANDVARQLTPIARQVRLLNLGKEWPRCPEGGDISDFFARGHKVEDLWKIVEQLPDWTPPSAVQTIKLLYPFPIVGHELPLRPVLVPGLLLRKQVTLLVAPPGIGKSLLSLQISMLCGAGLPEWGGWKPRGKYRILIINSEEDDDEQRRRLYAAAEKMGIDQSLLDGIALAAQPDTIVIAKADSRTKTVTRAPMMDSIIKTILEGKFDIVIVDPFAETFIGDENSNSELKWAAVLWREVARVTNTAVFLVHHARKYASDMAGDMDAARGGGALAGVARTVCTLFGMTKDDAAKMGITDDTKRARLLRFDDAKANLSLISHVARWFEKTSFKAPMASCARTAPWTSKPTRSGSWCRGDRRYSNGRRSFKTPTRPTPFSTKSKSGSKTTTADRPASHTLQPQNAGQKEESGGRASLSSSIWCATRMKQPRSSTCGSRTGSLKPTRPP
jgi:hypothetical protein